MSPMCHYFDVVCPPRVVLCTQEDDHPLSDGEYSVIELEVKSRLPARPVSDRRPRPVSTRALSSTSSSRRSSIVASGAAAADSRWAGLDLDQHHGTFVGGRAFHASPHAVHLLRAAFTRVSGKYASTQLRRAWTIWRQFVADHTLWERPAGVEPVRLAPPPVPSVRRLPTPVGGVGRLGSGSVTPTAAPVSSSLPSTSTSLAVTARGVVAASSGVALPPTPTVSLQDEIDLANAELSRMRRTVGLQARHGIRRRSMVALSLEQPSAVDVAAATTIQSAARMWRVRTHLQTVMCWCACHGVCWARRVASVA